MTWAARRRHARASGVQGSQTAPSSRASLPDAIGSICFLVSSALASYAVWELRSDARTRRIADLNLFGSIAFGFSAVASRLVDGTDQLANAALAGSGTFVGAICFFFAAWMLRREEPQPAAASS